MLRRILLPMLLAVVASALVAPGSAQATSAPAELVMPRIHAWNSVRGATTCGYYVQDGCITRPAPAWRWSNGRWAATTLPIGSWVYAYPWVAGWTWGYSHTLGAMVAIQDSHLSPQR